MNLLTVSATVTTLLHELRESSHLSSLVKIALATNAVSLHFEWPSDGSCHSPDTSQLSTRLGEPLAGTMYIVQCTVNSLQCTVYSARFLSLFCLYQLVPLLHVGLSSPESLPVVISCWGRTHYTLRGGGKALQMATRREKKVFHFRTISTKPFVKE